MSDHTKNEGHWQTHSYASKTTKVGDNPPTVSGEEASAKGTFDHGKPVVLDSHDVLFTNKGHPNTIEYKDNSGNQQKSIK